MLLLVSVTRPCVSIKILVKFQHCLSIWDLHIILNDLTPMPISQRSVKSYRFARFVSLLSKFSTNVQSCQQGSASVIQIRSTHSQSKRQKTPSIVISKILEKVSFLISQFGIRFYLSKENCTTFILLDEIMNMLKGIWKPVISVEKIQFF